MSIRVGAAIYLVSAVFQVFSSSLPMLIVGRSFQGFGVGVLAMTVPVFMCEVSPAHNRVLFVSIEVESFSFESIRDFIS